MLVALVQISVISIWGAMFTIHMRRLLRLAQVETIDTLRNQPMRHRLNRVWWWLGREEFWQKVQFDCLRCVELTVLLFIGAWGLLR